MIYIFPITMLIFLSAFNLVVIRAIISDDADSINRKRIRMMSIMLVFIIFSFILFAYMSKHATELLPI